MLVDLPLWLYADFECVQCKLDGSAIPVFHKRGYLYFKPVKIDRNLRKQKVEKRKLKKYH